MLCWIIKKILRTVKHNRVILFWGVFVSGLDHRFGHLRIWDILQIRKPMALKCFDKYS